MQEGIVAAEARLFDSPRPIRARLRRANTGGPSLSLDLWQRAWDLACCKLVYPSPLLVCTSTYRVAVTVALVLGRRVVQYPELVLYLLLS